MSRYEDHPKFNPHAQAAQSLLNSAGFNVGAADGLIGPKFLDGLRAALGQSAPKSAHGLTAPTAFYDRVRLEFGALKKEQVEGFEVLLKAMAAWPISWVAYGLATAWHETNKSMQPVAEAYYLGAGAEAWRKANLRYWPWYGRGYPQTTWEVNYQRADDALGLGGALMKNPDLMLTAQVAAPTMVMGMQDGWFTGKKLADYLPGDYVNARRIINGTDKAAQVADYAREFETALTAGGWA